MKRISVRIATLAFLIAVTAALGLLPSHSRVNATAGVLDHFKCYQTSAPFTPETVELQDQFDGARLELVTVVEPFRFCNPVAKYFKGKAPPLLDPDSHLKLYRIQTATTPTRTVVVDNQFGANQLLTVFDPIILAVPTRKLPHPAPVGLDHFKCYQASGNAVNVTVRLKDEFETERKVRVTNPDLFCNPTLKIHGGITTPIVNPTLHLVCYDISITPFTTSVATFNQFGNEFLNVLNADRLCVPSKKLSPA